jgi:uncharacterized phosphosugar-binding protein
MKYFDTFFEHSLEKMETVRTSQKEEILKAADLMCTCMQNGGIVQLAGVGHGIAFGMELGYRAGGLMPFHRFNKPDLAMRGVLKESDLDPAVFNPDRSNAQRWYDLYPIDPNDMFIISSYTGCEPVMCELAKIVKEKGFRLIAVVSRKALAKAKETSDIDSIDTYADLVIDTCTDVPDEAVDFDGTHGVGEINTIMSNMIAQMITAECYAWYKRRDIPCPVLLSVNVKGADAHNRAISDHYAGRWNA